MTDDDGYDAAANSLGCWDLAVSELRERHLTGGAMTDHWSKLTKIQQGALWKIQRDGGLMMTQDNSRASQSPYSTKAGREISIVTAQALIRSGELQAESTGFEFGQPQAWSVVHPKIGV